MSRLIDLSQEIYQGMNVYPGHLETVVWSHHHHWEDGEGLRGRFLLCLKGSVAERPSTHVDGLSHLDLSEDDTRWTSVCSMGTPSASTSHTEFDEFRSTGRKTVHVFRCTSEVELVRAVALLDE